VLEAGRASGIDKQDGQAPGGVSAWPIALMQPVATLVLISSPTRHFPYDYSAVSMPRQMRGANQVRHAAYERAGAVQSKWVFAITAARR
jgi:hypothetical protein